MTVAPGMVMQSREAAAKADHKDPVLPTMILSSIGGSRVPLAGFVGRPLLVNLWASWCPPCREEMRDLEAVYESRLPAGPLVVAVDQGESAEAVARFAAELQLKLPVLLDPDEALSDAFGFQELPVTLVVSRSGHVLRAVFGPMTVSMMRDELRDAEAQQ